MSVRWNRAECHCGEAWDRRWNQSTSGRKRHAQATAGHCLLKLERRLQFLSPRETSGIDDLLGSVSPVGEVRPAVEKGMLRFVPSVKGLDGFQRTAKSGGKGG